MKIELRQGVCRFCGQVGCVEAPEIPQDEIDELVTSMCYCESAADMRDERDRAQRIREAVDRAEKSIGRVFEDKPLIESILKGNVKYVAEGIIKQFTLKLADEDVTAQMNLKNDGFVKVIRKETETKVSE